MGFPFNSRRSKHSKHYHAQIHLKQSYLEFSKEGKAFPVGTPPLHLCQCIYFLSSNSHLTLETKIHYSFVKLWKVNVYLQFFYFSFCSLYIHRYWPTEIYHVNDISWCDTSLNHFIGFLLWYNLNYLIRISSNLDVF